MKRKSFSNKKKNYSIRLQKTVPPLPAQPAYRMQVSCATDRGPKSSNEDYYGFRHGSEIITFDQFRNSFITELSGHDDLVAAVADGVTMTWHPDNPEEDAQAIAVKYLLNTDYYRFNMDQQVPFIADDLNNLVLSTSIRLGGLMATTISAAGIHNGVDTARSQHGLRPLRRERRDKDNVVAARSRFDRACKSGNAASYYEDFAHAAPPPLRNIAICVFTTI